MHRYQQKITFPLENFWGGQTTVLGGPGPPWPPHGDATGSHTQIVYRYLKKNSLKIFCSLSYPWE